MRTSIKARDGYILTNGEIFGTEIYLADGLSGEAFYEIPFEEYEKMIEEGGDENGGNT